MTITDLVKKAYTDAEDKGFWDDKREFGTLIALIHSELSEALEADRYGDFEIVAEELADVAILLASLCGVLKIDLEDEIVKKMEYNTTRERLHGKRY